jgi:hypothetical protein
LAKQKRSPKAKKPRKKYRYLIPNLRFFLISILLFGTFDKLKPLLVNIQFGNMEPDQFVNTLWVLAIGAVIISAYHLFRSIWKLSR